MRLIHLNEFRINRESILFMNGGGQIVFSKHSKLVKYFNQYNYNLIGVELPGHGRSSFPQALSKNEFISHFEKEFKGIIKNENIKVHTLVGFSLGGLLALKVIELNLMKVNYVIVFGCGFGIGEDEKNMFNYYTSEKFFRDMNWEKIMKKNHGKGWYNLLLSMDSLMNVKSPIFTDPKKLSDDSKILIILGENEELFTTSYTEKMISLNPHNTIHLQTVPNTSHFEYTSKSWENFQDVLTKFILRMKWFN